MITKAHSYPYNLHPEMIMDSNPDIFIMKNLMETNGHYLYVT